MAIESVRIAFVTDDITPALVGGVAVRVFDMVGNLVTTAVSGEGTQEGTAEVELPGDMVPIDYVLRFYYPGGAISPKRIQVYSPPTEAPTGTNNFVITTPIFRLEPALDPEMCRASGHILGPSGKPRAGVDVTFTPQFHAFVTDNKAVTTGRLLVRTDKNGFLAIDLFRYGMYDVTIEGKEVVQRSIVVPNRSSILMSHLLFPIVAAVQYDEPQPFSVAVGESLLITPHVRSTDFRDLGVAPGDVFYSTRHDTIATVQIYGERILIRGRSPGETTLRVARTDNSIVYLPGIGITGGDVSITVTS